MRVSYIDFRKQAEEQFEAVAVKMTDTLFEGDYILGKEVEYFEREFADFVRVKHAVGVGNGTDSLILMMKALGIGAGDEVITCPNSWVSSASSIALVGAKPVFCDVLPNRLIDHESCELAITRRTKAIIPVHLGGLMCDIDNLQLVADRHGLPILEDAAQAIGSWNGLHRAGASSLMASFSLHPLKNLNACGDAGIITTDDDNLAAWLRQARNHGLSDRDHVQFWGYNSRLDTLQAAILRVKLLGINGVLEKRRAHADRYTTGLQGYVVPPDQQPGHSYHTYTIQCDRRDELKAYLEENLIEAKIHYPIPIHLQQAAKELEYMQGDFPNVEAQAKTILSLPIHQHLTSDQIDFVISKIRAFYDQEKV